LLVGIRQFDDLTNGTDPVEFNETPTLRRGVDAEPDENGWATVTWTIPDVPVVSW
jgi:hypothetical protein